MTWSRKSYKKLKEIIPLKRSQPGSLWKIINHAIPSKDKQRPAFTKDVTVLTNEFNQFFAKVGLNAADAVQHLREEHNIIVRYFSSETGIDTTSMQLFSLRTVSHEEVCQIVISLPMNTRWGFLRQDQATSFLRGQGSAVSLVGFLQIKNGGRKCNQI